MKLRTQRYQQVDLEVVAMNGWNRSMYFRDTGLLWVPPSPNIPSSETCLFYLGMALFEVSSLVLSSVFYLREFRKEAVVLYHLFMIQRYFCPSSKTRNLSQGSNCSEGRGTALPFQMVSLTAD